MIISHNSINLEKPSSNSTEKANEILKTKLEAPVIVKNDAKKDENVVIHRRKKAKGPNPLSCKKKIPKPKYSQNKNANTNQKINE
jgi:hypothetical protein